MNKYYRKRFFYFKLKDKNAQNNFLYFNNIKSIIKNKFE